MHLNDARSHLFFFSGTPALRSVEAPVTFSLVSVARDTLFPKLFSVGQNCTMQTVMLTFWVVGRTCPSLLL